MNVLGITREEAERAVAEARAVREQLNENEAQAERTARALESLRTAIKGAVLLAIYQAEYLGGGPADKADRISNDAADAVLAIVLSQPASGAG